MYSPNKLALSVTFFSITKVASVISLLVGSEGRMNSVNIPLNPHPLRNSHDQGNCKESCAPRPVMLAEPVGNATPNTAERSTFPGIVLICHFTAGATSENPEPSRPRTFAKYVGTSTRIRDSLQCLRANVYLCRPQTDCRLAHWN